MKHSYAVLAVLAACTPMAPAASSTSVLPPERTWVIVNRPAQPAALDVARLFAARGFPLLDAQTDERGVLLRFKGERRVVAEQIIGALDVLDAVVQVAAVLDTKHPYRHQHIQHDPQIAEYALGSVFYVRVEPRGETMTSIAAMGRPTRDGIEACTPDRDIQAPCAPLETGPDVHNEVAGYAEAELIDGVFAELRLSGAVIGPDVETMEANRKCWNQRREKEQAAARVSNPRAKAGIMRTAPTCATQPEAALAAK